MCTSTSCCMIRTRRRRCTKGYQGVQRDVLVICGRRKPQGSSTRTIGRLTAPAARHIEHRVPGKPRCRLMRRPPFEPSVGIGKTFRQFVASQKISNDRSLLFFSRLRVPSICRNPSSIPTVRSLPHDARPACQKAFARGCARFAPFSLWTSPALTSESRTSLVVVRLCSSPRSARISVSVRASSLSVGEAGEKQFAYRVLRHPASRSSGDVVLIHEIDREAGGDVV